MPLSSQTSELAAGCTDDLAPGHSVRIRLLNPSDLRRRLREDEGFKEMIKRSEGCHSALTSASRRRVLDALLASRAPLNAAVVAEQVGLQVTTARFGGV